MKKLKFLSVCFLLSFSLTACTKSLDDTTLKIATEQLSGDFMDGFTASDYDMDIIEMIHGYTTFDHDETGAMVLNEVPVINLDRKVDESTGNVRYDYTLADDLKWSDGQALTAKDYVFGVLFDSSKEWIDAGALNANYDHVLGYMEYSQTSADEIPFPGVIYLDDTHFSIILDGSLLPYYNEEILAMVTPRPMHIFTNGSGSIISDEQGSSLDGITMHEVTTYAKDEYRKQPTVSSGPYMFTSYENKVVKLTKNPYFKGDFRNQIPEIATIIIKEIDSALQLDALINKDVDLISNIIEEADVKKAKEHDDLTIAAFESMAYGNLAFACDFGPTSDYHVRRAINYALDKNELIQTALGGMAIPISSDYVPAQWMVKEAEDELKGLNAYAFDLDKAKSELDESSYVYEADGKTSFDETKVKDDGSYVRYNNLGEPLEIRHLGSEGNTVTDAIQLQLTKNAMKIGMKFTVDYGDFSSITDNYYNGSALGESRRYHSFNLASVLQPGYDPYYNFHSIFAGSPMNPSGIQDEQLDESLDIMEYSDVKDKEGYLDAWVAYEYRFNEVLPVIPLYISQEHVIHSNRLQHVNVNTMEGFSHIISGIRFK